MIPGYLSTEDPRVIADIKRLDDEYAAAHRAICEFAQAHGGIDGSHYGGPNPFGGYDIVAVNAQEKPTEGRWKSGPHGCGYAPWANTDLGRQMQELNYRPIEQAVGGIPLGIHVPGVLARVTSFVTGGVAYAHIPHADRVDETQFDLDEYGWAEILGTAFHQAHEEARSA